LHDHGSGGHEFDELAEERAFAMDRIEGFRLLAADARALLRDDTQARALDHSVDRTGQVAGGGIGFDDRKGTLDRHLDGSSTRKTQERGSRRLIATMPQRGKA
jgi:hypothetical protein